MVAFLTRPKSERHYSFLIVWFMVRNASVWEESSFLASDSVATHAIVLILDEAFVSYDFFKGLQEPLKNSVKRGPADWPKATSG